MWWAGCAANADLAAKMPSRAFLWKLGPLHPRGLQLPSKDISTALVQAIEDVNKAKRALGAALRSKVRLRSQTAVFDVASHPSTDGCRLLAQRPLPPPAHIFPA